MEKRKRGLLAVPLFYYFLLIALILFAGGIWRYYYVKGFLNNSFLTKAVIVSAGSESELVQDDKGRYEQRITYHTEMRYRDRKGEEYKKSYSGGTDLGDEGDSVGIYYSLSDPGWSLFEEDVKSGKAVWLLFGFSGFFLLFSFIFYKRYKYVLNNPHVIED